MGSSRKRDRISPGVFTIDCWSKWDPPSPLVNGWCMVKTCWKYGWYIPESDDVRWCHYQWLWILAMNCTETPPPGWYLQVQFIQVPTTMSLPAGMQLMQLGCFDLWWVLRPASSTKPWNSVLYLQGGAPGSQLSWFTTPITMVYGIPGRYIYTYYGS